MTGKEFIMKAQCTVGINVIVFRKGFGSCFVITDLWEAEL